MIFGMNEYPNIFVTIDIGQMNLQIYLSGKNIIHKYLNKFALEKSLNILANEYICPKYLNIFEYLTIGPRLS